MKVEQWGEVGWRERALILTQANDSKFGCILMAAFGMMPVTPPRMGLYAEVTSDNNVLCLFQKRDGTQMGNLNIGTLSYVVTNTYALVRQMDLRHSEGIELMNTVVDWLRMDFEDCMMRSAHNIIMGNK